MSAFVRQSPRRVALVAERADELEVLLAEGHSALATDGDLRTGRQRFEAAYRVAEQEGDAQAMAVAALGMAGLWVHEHRTVSGSVLLETRLRHALSLLDRRSVLALRIRARLTGEIDYRRGEHAAILAILQQASGVAEPVARAEALSLAHHCLLGPGHGAQRRELAVELVRESFSTSRRSDLLMGLLWQTVDLFLDADPHAERRLGELRNLLARQEHLAVGFVVSAIEVMLAIRAGRLEDAETMSIACARRGVTAGDIDAEGWHRAQILTIRWYQGRLAELLPVLEELAHSPALSAVDNAFLAALAVSAAAAGDRRKAASALAALCGNDLAGLPRSSSWLAMMNGVVEAAYLLEDAVTSARAYELLTPFAHLPMVGSLGVTCFGSLHHALGVASLTCGDTDRAVEHLSAAVRQNLALAHWPAVVTSRQRLAQALALRGRPRDVAAAQRELAAAADEARALDIAIPADVIGESPGKTVACARQGHSWRIDVGDRSVLVRHSIGMFHLAVLIANPGQEIRAVDLVAGLAVLSNVTDSSAASAQPILDHEAIRDYRRRLKDLHEQIGELESGHQPDRAARAREERDWLLTELARATQIGGRARPFPDGEERARIAVGKAIRRALIRITEADAPIGEHLRQTVHTGVRCWYRPA
jgi:hypothetical protein